LSLPSCLDGNSETKPYFQPKTEQTFDAAAKNTVAQKSVSVVPQPCIPAGTLFDYKV
jgi:hypothetical protein